MLAISLDSSLAKMRRFGGSGQGRWRRLSVGGPVAGLRLGPLTEVWDATPVGLCAVGYGAGPCRLPHGGRTQPGSASHAVPGGTGRWDGFSIPLTVASACPKARDEGTGGHAAAEAARGAEVLPGPGERPVRQKHP